MSSKSRKRGNPDFSDEDDASNNQSQPPVKKQKLADDVKKFIYDEEDEDSDVHNTQNEDGNMNEMEVDEIEEDEDEEETEEEYEEYAGETFYDLLRFNNVSDLLDPFCGGDKPTSDNLMMLNRMESMLNNIVYEIRKRKSYISKQKQIARNKWLDSFISINEGSIQSYTCRDDQYADDKRSSYECNIQIGGQTVVFNANWYCGGWEVFGYTEIKDIFKYGRSPDDLTGKDEMIYYDVQKGTNLRKNCKDIVDLSSFTDLSADSSNFDWITEILSLGLEVLDRVDKGNWMKSTFDPKMYVWETLHTFKRNCCVKERNEYNAIISHWIKNIQNEKNCPFVIGTDIKRLIKCFACTNHGVCCGLMHKQSKTVVYADFI